MYDDFKPRDPFAMEKRPSGSFSEIDIKEKLKPFLNLKYFIIIIIIIVLVFLFLELFKPTHNVQFLVKDFENNDLEATITVVNNPPSIPFLPYDKSFSLQSGDSIALSEGIFAYSVHASGFESTDGKINVSGDLIKTIKLIKVFNFAISSENLPSTIFSSQDFNFEKGIKLVVKNNSNKDASFEFDDAIIKVVSKVKKGLDKRIISGILISFDKSHFIKAKQEIKIPLSISINDSIPLSNEPVKIDIEFNIKNSKTKGTISFFLKKLPELSVSPRTKFEVKNVSAGTGKQEIVKEIVISNKSRDSIEPIKAALSFTEGEELSNYCELTPSTLPAIKPSSSESIIFRCNIPGSTLVTAASGSITLSNSYFNKLILFGFTVKVPETKYDVTIKKDDFELSIGLAGVYDKKTTKVVVTNKGNTILKSISFTVLETECLDFLEIVKASLKRNLLPSDKDDSDLIISAPQELSTGEKRQCTLKTVLIDEFNRLYEERNIITITTVASSS